MTGMARDHEVDLRARAIRRKGPNHREGNPSGVCDHCDEWSPGLELDHIIPLLSGGAHDRENLQWLCSSCHRIKTGKEQRKPYTGTWSEERRAGYSERRRKAYTEAEREAKREAARRQWERARAEGRTTL